jgi:hypothetical protein
MKRDNEISKGVLFKTPFSEELARIGSPDSAKYITKNRITGGLWLVENIELPKRLIPAKRRRIALHIFSTFSAPCAPLRFTPRTCHAPISLR